MGLFYGVRTKWEEKIERVESDKRPGKHEERKYMHKSFDRGLLCFLKQKGNVMIPGILDSELKELVSE